MAKAEAKAVRLKEKREQHKSRAALEMQIEQTKNTEIWQSFINSYSHDSLDSNSNRNDNLGYSGSGKSGKRDSPSSSSSKQRGTEGEEQREEHSDEVQKLCARGIPPNMRGAGKRLNDV